MIHDICRHIRYMYMYVCVYIYIYICICVYVYIPFRNSNWLTYQAKSSTLTQGQLCKFYFDDSRFISTIALDSRHICLKRNLVQVFFHFIFFLIIFTPFITKYKNKIIIIKIKLGANIIWPLTNIMGSKYLT